MSKTAKATTAKSLSTLSSFPSHAWATRPSLYLWMQRCHTIEGFPWKKNLYEDGPALLPVDNDIRDAGSYKTVDAPTSPDQGIVVNNVVTHWGGQHLNFKALYRGKVLGKQMLYLLHPKKVDRCHSLPFVNDFQEQPHQQLKQQTYNLMGSCSQNLKNNVKHYL